jgi:TonB family protein
VPRRSFHASIVASALIAGGASLLGGCATGESAQEAAGTSGRSMTRGRPTSGYEVREASEAADTDGLQISLQHGVISQQAAQDAVSRHFNELTRCYGEAGAAMGFAGGEVTLRFVVDARGTTSDVRVVASRLGNFEVERCLVTVGQTVQFPRPQGNAVATIDYPLEFRSTGDIPVVDLASGELEAELPALYGRLRTACNSLGADEVSATLYIDATGAVRSAGLSSAEAFDGEAGRCVSAALRRWTVRLASIEGGVGRVTVPLTIGELVARREPSSEVRRYSRASATARARSRRDRSR